MGRENWLPAIVAAVTGIAVWLLLPVWTHQSEAWDSSIFWPSMIVISAVFGFIVPRRAWCWGLAIVSGQVVVFLIQVVLKPGSLWPIGLIFLLASAGFFAVVSQCGGLSRAFIDRKRQRDDAS